MNPEEIKIRLKNGSIPDENDFGILIDEATKKVDLTEYATKDEIPTEYYGFISSTAFLTTAKKEEKYYLLNQDILKEAGITNCDYTYIVNYSRGEVMNSEIQETASGRILYMSNEFKAFE